MRLVVHHKVHARSLGHGGIDLLEEVKELGCPVALVAFADHRARSDVESCEQRGRASANIGLGTPLGDARRHRHGWLFSIVCLDLELLVDTQHHC